MDVIKLQELEKYKADLETKKLNLEDELKDLEIKIELERSNSRKLVTDVNGNPLPCKLYMDGYLRSNLELLRDLIKKDWDSIGFICGYEGDGKSVLAQQIALTMNHNFRLKHIVFTSEQFEEVADQAEKGDVIVWDEADDLASNWSNSLLLSLKKKFKTIRAKNLSIILVTPSLFDVNKYFAISRTRYLIHVYSAGLERGYFRFFNRDTKKDLYLLGRKEWAWNAVRENFRGRFTKLPDGFPINQDEYKKKKAEATENIINKPQQNLTMLKTALRRKYLSNAVFILSNKYNVNVAWSDYAKIFECGASTIKDDRKEDVFIRKNPDKARFHESSDGFLPT